MPRLAARIERLAQTANEQRPIRILRSYAEDACPPGQMTAAEAADEAARLQALGYHVVVVRFVRAEGAASHPPPAHA